jgi:tight adherence protein C
MNSTIILAIMISVVALGVLLIYRLVNFLRARLPQLKLPQFRLPQFFQRNPKPSKTLMRVGQVAPVKPPEPPRTQVKTTPVTETATAVPAPHGAYSAPKSATTMFEVAQLRDKASFGDQLDMIDPADTPLADGSDYAFGPGLTPFLAGALPDSKERKIELKQDLIRAGYYQPHAFDNIQAIRWIFLTVPLLLLCVMVNVLPQRLELWAIGTMLAVAVLGWALPKLYIASQAADRRSEIERSLPDVLDMLNMCVSQGMTLIAALKRVTSELRTVFPALSQELQIVAEQAELGTLEQALTNFSRRVDAPDVHSFTSLLIQTERMGTSVSVALGEYAENMRESLRQRADEKANKATFQLLFPTVLFLMPAVYIFLLGPSIIKLTDFFAGKTTNASQQAVENFERVNAGQNPGVPQRQAN